MIKIEEEYIMLDGCNTIAELSNKEEEVLAVGVTYKKVKISKSLFNIMLKNYNERAQDLYLRTKCIQDKYFYEEKAKLISAKLVKEVIDDELGIRLCKTKKKIYKRLGVD